MAAAGPGLPSPHRLHPYSSHGEISPQKAQGSRAPDPRQGLAPGRAEAGSRARRSAQSRHQQGNRRHGFRHRRASAAAGQFVRSPPGFLRRASGAQVEQVRKGLRRSAADRLHRRAGHRARSGAGARNWARRRSNAGRPARGVRPRSRAHPRAAAIRNTACRKADLPTGPGGLSSMGVAATAESLERLLREGRPEFARPASRGRRTGRRGRRNPKAASASSSSPSSSPRATSRRRSANWSRASSATTARRCCSASPAPARPSPWPR